MNSSNKTETAPIELIKPMGFDFLHEDEANQVVASDIRGGNRCSTRNSCTSQNAGTNGDTDLLF